MFVFTIFEKTRTWKNKNMKPVFNNTNQTFPNKNMKPILNWFLFSKNKNRGEQDVKNKNRFLF